MGSIFRRGSRGFTLIELLVVISIIALLSSIVMAAVSSARDKAKMSRAKQEMAQFARAVAVAQGESNKVLWQITGNGCSACACSGDIRNTTGACYTNWVNVLTTVQASTNGLVSSALTTFTRDPWGSPYVVDENEAEYGASDCRLDYVETWGPNGTSGGGDDVKFTLPLKKNPCP